MSDESIEDIKRVLTICFRSGNSLSVDSIERIFSFDMGWMDTETAHDAVKGLIFAGWLIESDGMYSANCDLKGIKAPLGWQPRPSRLTNPTTNEEQQKPRELALDTKPLAPRPVIKEIEEIVDPRSKVEKRLVKYISKQTGLELAEIERRVDRKIRSFRYCTTWLALCLISREQDLEMDPIIDSLSPSA